MPESKQLYDKTPDVAQIEHLLRTMRPQPDDRLRQRMAGTPWQTGQRVKSQGIFMSRTAALVAAVLVLIAILLATPVGSVFADQIIHFFVRAPSNAVALPTEQVLPPIPTASPAPTHALALLPAEQVADVTPTAQPTPVLDPAALKDMSLFLAEEAAGFDLYEPVMLPRDYRLTRILYDPDHQAVSLQYASPRAGSGEFFQITQGKNLEPLSVGPDAQVESVKVGSYTAEFVRGQWFTANGAREATWEDQAEIYTLRWQAEEAVVSISFFLNDSFSPAYLERDEMLVVARSMARCAAAGDIACELDKAAAAAGFVPWQFPADPDGLTFRRVDYRSGLTALWYTSGSGQFTVLQSRQAFTTQEEEAWLGVPAGAIQNVRIAGQPGEYVKGSFMVHAGESTAVWEADSPLERLRWQNEGWWFQIVKTGEPDLTPQQFADLAGQLSADPSGAVQIEQQPTAQPASGFERAYTDLADLEASAGVDLFEPGTLPAGLGFSHARYDPSVGAMLFYGNFAADKYHSNSAVLIVSQKLRSAVQGKITDAYPLDALRAVEVNGNPAWLIRGTLMTEMAKAGEPMPAATWLPDTGVWMLAWETADWTLSVQFDPSGRGERLNEQDLIEIAESLR